METSRLSEVSEARQPGGAWSAGRRVPGREAVEAPVVDAFGMDEALAAGRIGPPRRALGKPCIENTPLPGVEGLEVSPVRVAHDVDHEVGGERAGMALAEGAVAGEARRDLGGRQQQPKRVRRLPAEPR